MKTSKWNAHFPSRNSVWESCSTIQETPCYREIFRSGDKINLSIYLPCEISGILWQMVNKHCLECLIWLLHGNKGPFINYGSGGAGGKLGGPRKKSQQGGGGFLNYFAWWGGGGLEKNELVSSDYPCQRNKHCRIPCTHLNLDHSKCEV